MGCAPDRSGAGPPRRVAGSAGDPGAARRCRMASTQRARPRRPAAGWRPPASDRPGDRPRPAGSSQQRCSCRRCLTRADGRCRLGQTGHRPRDRRAFHAETGAFGQSIGHHGAGASLPPRPGAAHRVRPPGRPGRAPGEHPRRRSPAALELGATGLESDAWITADGEVVLDHDGVTGPLWRRRPISAQPRAALPVTSRPWSSYTRRVRHRLRAVARRQGPGRPRRRSWRSRTRPGARPRCGCAIGDRRCWRGWRASAAPARLVESTRCGRHRGGHRGRAAAACAAAASMPSTCTAANGPGRRRGGARRRPGAPSAGTPRPAAEIRRLLGLGVDGVYSDHVDRMMASIREWPGSDLAPRPGAAA